VEGEGGEKGRSEDSEGLLESLLSKTDVQAGQQSRKGEELLELLQKPTGQGDRAHRQDSAVLCCAVLCGLSILYCAVPCCAGLYCSIFCAVYRLCWMHLLLLHRVRAQCPQRLYSTVLNLSSSILCCPVQFRTRGAPW